MWCNHWLFRGGGLTLVKSILEAIPIYWLSLACIPKGVLENIHKLCFNFYWSGKEGREGTYYKNYRLVYKTKWEGG